LDYKKKEERKKRHFIITSFIIHLILLILFFAFYKYSLKDYKFPKKPAKVIFKKPQPKPKPPKPKPKPKPKPQPKLPAYQGVRKPAPKPKPQPKPEPKPKEEKKLEPKKIEKKTEETKIEKPPPEKKTITKKSISKDIAIKPPAKKIPIAPPKTIQKPKPIPRKKPKPQKKFSLSDLSKGFLDYSQKHGANLIQYTNSAKGVPTEEQLKHERYISRVFSCIETSMKIKRNSLAIRQNISPNEILTVVVQIVLNTNGKINRMNVSKSSGIREFDNFMLNIVNDSSSSFPPVPSYLSKDTYYIPIKFFIPAGMVMVQNSMRQPRY